MKAALLVVVNSTQRSGLMSLRGPKGQGKNDSIHEHVTAAGFKDGEEVVLISRAAAAALNDMALENCAQNCRPFNHTRLCKLSDAELSP